MQQPCHALVFGNRYTIGAEQEEIALRSQRVDYKNPMLDERPRPRKHIEFLSPAWSSFVWQRGSSLLPRSQSLSISQNAMNMPDMPNESTAEA